MSLRLTRYRDVDRDFAELPTNGHIREALRLIGQLKDHPFKGQKLDYHVQTGDLRACRKLYFSDSPVKRPDYRIVYRLLPDEDSPQEVRIITVGKREEGAVYMEAAQRLLTE